MEGETHTVRHVNTNHPISSDQTTHTITTVSEFHRGQQRNCPHSLFFLFTSVTHDVTLVLPETGAKAEAEAKKRERRANTRDIMIRTVESKQ